MKIKTSTMSFEDVMKLPRPEHRKPCRPSRALAALVRLYAAGELKKVDFTYTCENMEKAGDGPWLVLMNHSSFLDLAIASRLLYPRPYNIVCTSDGLVGKEGIMRRLGCIPTQKFVSDISLISDIHTALHENGSSVLMYPEASYSFDGTATPLPRKMGILLRKLKVPVVMITTYGSFARDPLYNNLQLRDVKVCAKMECLLSAAEVAETKLDELDRILDEAFDLDYFRWQKENGVEIREEFRADGLHRILYRCPSCRSEGRTKGAGIRMVCEDCGHTVELGVDGQLSAASGQENHFRHIPDWYRWEREMVRREIEAGEYVLEVPVEIGCIVDFNALYMVGEGTLRHDGSGFTLDGCDGALHYEQDTRKCYSLYSDYFWYEIGDVICIGDKDCLYYCFPKVPCPVAKARLAAEEMYKLSRRRKPRKAEAASAE